MAIGPQSIYSYRLRGVKPDASGSSLEEALIELVNFWISSRSLAMHIPGNLVLQLTIAGVDVTLEITDPIVLEDLVRIGPTAVIDEIASKMGMDPALGKSLLEHASTYVRVDALQVPFDSGAWRPDRGKDAASVFETARNQILANASREQDLIEQRRPRQRRSPESIALIRALVASAKGQGKSMTVLARETGLPVSTLRDAARTSARTRRPSAPIKKTNAHYSDADKATLTRLLKEERLTVQQVSARTGVPERTLRDLRSAPPPRSARPRPEQKEDLLRRVRDGEVASVVARDLGIAPRTARAWAKQDRASRFGTRTPDAD